jgi:hypothetical protein
MDFLTPADDDGRKRVNPKSLKEATLPSDRLEPSMAGCIKSIVGKSLGITER